MAFDSVSMRAKMDQVKDRSLAAKADHAQKISQQWINQMSSVIENQFNIMGNKNGEWNKKVAGDSFMDKSVEMNADSIMENVKTVLNHMKKNPPLQELNKKLIMAMVALQTASIASPAFADTTEKITAQALQGPVSYSQFLEGVQTGLIEKLRVEPNGRTADFINTEGFRGKVELFNDPEFLNTIQKYNVDLYVMNAGNPEQQNQIFQIF